MPVVRLPLWFRIRLAVPENVWIAMTVAISPFIIIAWLAAIMWFGRWIGVVMGIDLL